MVRFNGELLIGVSLLLVLAGCDSSTHEPDEDGGSQPHDSSTPEPDGSVDPQPDGGTPGPDGSVDPMPDGSVDPMPDGSVDPMPDGSMSEDGGDGSVAADGGEPELCRDDERIVLGAASSPIEVTLAALPVEGIVDWRGLAFYRVTGVTPGTSYAVTLLGDYGLTLLIPGDDDSFESADCTERYPSGINPARCTVVPNASSFVVAIDMRSQNGAFTLDVAPLTEPEGTYSEPLELASADLPYQGLATLQASTVYELTGLTSGQPYAITVQADNYVSVGIYPVGSGPAIYRKSHTRLARAFGTPADTSLLLAVEGVRADTSFEVEVEPLDAVSEGTTAAPVAIDSASQLPYSGAVGSSRLTGGPTPSITLNGESVYAITGLAPGGYLVTLDAPAGVMVASFGDDATFANTSFQCAPVVSDDTARCGARITGTTLYVKVLNPEAATELTLDLAPLPFTAEGSEAAPLALGSASLPHEGAVESRVSSYYEATGLTPGQSYVVRLADLSDSYATVDVSDGTEPSCSFTTYGTHPTPACIATASGTTLSIVVHPYTPSPRDKGFGTRFALDVEPYVPDGVGSAEEPLEVSCSEAFDTEVGELSTSYYEVTDLVPGVPHIVEVFGLESFDGALTVAPSDGAIEVPPCATIQGEGVLRCVVTSDTGAILVRVSSGLADDFTLSVRAVLAGSEGSVAAPIELTLNDPPYEGTVASAAPSYYEITGLTPGIDYTIRLASIDERIEVTALEGSVFMTEVLASGGVDQSSAGDFVLNPTVSTVYVLVSLAPEHDGVSAITLDAFPFVSP